MSTRTRSTLPDFTSRCKVNTPRPGLDAQRVVGRQAVVVDELGDAADAVAAHLRLAAVGVEHAHLRVGDLGGADEDEAVAADAEVPVADAPGELGGVGGRRLADAIDVDVVVADAVHLVESHGPDSLLHLLHAVGVVDHAPPALAVLHQPELRRVALLQLVILPVGTRQRL